MNPGNLWPLWKSALEPTAFLWCPGPPHCCWPAPGRSWLPLPGAFPFPVQAVLLPRAGDVGCWALGLLSREACSEESPPCFWKVEGVLHLGGVEKEPPPTARACSSTFNSSKHLKVLSAPCMSSLAGAEVTAVRLQSCRVAAGGGDHPAVTSGEETLMALGQGWTRSAGALGSFRGPGCGGSAGDTGPPGSRGPRSDDGDCFGGICSGHLVSGEVARRAKACFLEELSSNLGFTTYLPVAHENLISEPVSSSVKWVIIRPPSGFYGVQMRCYVWDTMSDLCVRMCSKSWAPYLSEEEQGSAGMGSFLFFLFPATSIPLLPLGGLLFHSSP